MNTSDRDTASHISNSACLHFECTPLSLNDAQRSASSVQDVRNAFDPDERNHRRFERDNRQSALLSIREGRTRRGRPRWPDRRKRGSDRRRSSTRWSRWCRNRPRYRQWRWRSRRRRPWCQHRRSRSPLRPTNGQFRALDMRRPGQTHHYRRLNRQRSRRLQQQRWKQRSSWLRRRSSQLAGTRQRSCRP